MENGTYYERLGVSVKATISEITVAKNELAKQYHPDANMKNGVDTTSIMQEILLAFDVLSNPQKRAEYDQKLSGKTSKMQTFDLKNAEEAPEGNTFIVYWKAAGELYELVAESNSLSRQKHSSSKLTQLSLQAIQYILILREGKIPEKYWHPDIMNWLLFAWYQNRNLTIAYLLTRYDDYLKKTASPAEKLKLQGKSYRFRHSVKKLVKY